MNYFKDLFTEDNFDRPKLNTRYNYPQIEDEILLCFRRDIEDDEIKEAIRSMGVLKSPGPDGIGAIFYQSQWEHIGDSVTSTIMPSSTMQLLQNGNKYEAFLP